MGLAKQSAPHLGAALVSGKNLLALPDDDASTTAGSTPSRLMSLNSAYESTSDSSSDAGEEEEIGNSFLAQQRTPSPEMRCYISGRAPPPPPSVVLQPVTFFVMMAGAEVKPVPAVESAVDVVGRPVRRAATTATCQMPRRVSWADFADEEEEEESVLGSAPAGACPPAETIEDCARLSVGSAGHLEGTCRPCAHIWRPNGCSKGRDCTYCHACGRKEFVAYKQECKVNKALARKAARQATEELSAVVPAEDASSEFCCEYSVCTAAQCSQAQVPPELPSVGSAGHACGTCRPCAHHWKPSGCAMGSACTFCHLCGEAAFHAFRRLGKGQKELRVPRGASSA